MNIPTPKIKAEANNDYTQSVLDLMEITKMDLIIGQLVIGMRERSKASIKQGSPDADPVVLDETLKAFEEEFEKEAPTLLEEIAELYKTILSKDDILEVLNFYKSDIGQKFLNGSASMEQGLQQTAQTWAQAASKAAFTRATKRVNEE